MGLLKGSNIRFTDGEAIIGDEVILGAEEQVTTVVPHAPAPTPEAPPQPGEEGWELGDEFDQWVEEEVPAQEAAPVAGPIGEYEEVRDHLLASAEEAAQLDAGAYNEQVQTAAGDYMEAELEAGRVALEEANPTGDFEQVAPYMQRRIAAELDLELVGSVNEIRWTHLQRIEEKIVDEVGQVAGELEAAHPPETFVELLAQREKILSEARLEAQRVLMEAQTQASAIMAEGEKVQAQTLMELEAERERILEELKQEAYQTGYDEGKQAGEQQAAEYIQEALTKLNEIAVALPNAVKQNEEKLVSLALDIASKVIQEEISLQPEIVQRTVETALRRVSDLESVTIKVNPLDLDLILPKQDTFKALVPDVQNFSIEGSHTLQRGGCVIETNSGSINASINAQLGIVEELFRNVRAEYEDDAMGEMG